MPQNIKIYKFLFRANITIFDLKANISSPLIVTWKRSNESASTQSVEMTSGKAEINQILTLPVNMYFDLNDQKFQQKKSVFSFTMRSPKGDKQAGVVYVDLAHQVNERIQNLEKVYNLQKCPVKNSEVKIIITSQCIGQKDHDSVSQNSMLLPEGTPSTLSVESHVTEEKRQKVKQVTNKSAQTNKQNLNTAIKASQSVDNQQKDRKMRQLEDLVRQLNQQNKKLKTQLTNEKQMSKKMSSSSGDGSLINNLKEELMKGKSIQSKLQSQIDSYRQQNQQHEKQLQSIRQKMDRIYDTLCKQFDIQQL